MRIFFLLFLLPAAGAEAFLHHEFGLAALLVFWLGLTVHADRAARRFLKAGLRGEEAPLPDPAAEAEGEVIRLRPLGGRKSEQSGKPHPPPSSEERSQEDQESQSGPEGSPRKPRKTAAESGSPLALRREAAAPLRPRKKPRPLPTAPNFQGKPHEVLGISETAATNTIGEAFRHWIKHFHPDRGREENNQQTLLLLQARQSLLSRRRKHSGKKAA